jgi:hypothetical protein
MQHLDEGTIHSWLDGALSAGEAARVSAHVEECPQCAAAVAEARGFIAASSRILTALDHVARGVVPIATRATPRNWAAWRAAAAVLVVALGSFAVLRERMSTHEPLTKTVAIDAKATAPAAADVPASTDSVQPTPAPVAQTPAARIPSVRTPLVRAPEAAPPTRAAIPSVASRVGNQEGQTQSAVSELAAGPQPAVAADAGRATRENGAVSQRVDAPTMKASATTGSGIAVSTRGASVARVVFGDSTAAPTPIRVVSTRKAIGERRTVYEVAPGDTVLLAETLNVESVVVTSLGATRAPQSADTSTARRIQIRGTSTMSTAPDTQNNKASFSPRPAAAAAPSVATLNGVTTLTWTDAGSGNTMKLSGRHSPAELLEIRRRIEQLRAAEAAAKKTP